MEHRQIYEEWLNSPHIAADEKQQLQSMSEEEVYEAFYKYAEFGTAGMRGIMGLGTNRINKYTIRMAAKGLAQMLGEGTKVAVAYDTRNHSKEFAEESAKVLAASGIKAMLFDCCSPVPLLSFAVRELECDGGIVITASHNTKEYNGFKVYDRTGCQMNTEMAGIIAENIAGLKDGLAVEAAYMDHENIRYIDQNIINSFLGAVQQCSVGIASQTAKNLKVIYTPLHGSGRDYVLNTLEKAGFDDVILVEEQANHDGNFPTVKKPNPEDKAAFAIAEKVALESQADIIIGTDPDCDRIGVGVKKDGEIIYLTGNETGVLLIDFLARTKPSAGKKLITTIVTSDMGRAVAQSYGIDVVTTFTGFKNIGGEMNRMAEDEFFMGYEESYGYIAGMHARDKDGVSSALIICQMAAWWKAQGKTLTDALESLYDIHGYWIDEQESFTFEGAEGAKRIEAIMKLFREKQDDVFFQTGQVVEVLDYEKGVTGFPPANVLKYIFADGSWIAIRPSGTEPKIKFYYCITGKARNEAQQIYEAAAKQVAALV